MQLECLCAIIQEEGIQNSTVVKYTLVCTKLHQAGAPSSSQVLPTEGCALDASALETCKCGVWSSATGEGESCTYCCWSSSPLEVEVPGPQVFEWGSRILDLVAAGTPAVSKAY